MRGISMCLLIGILLPAASSVQAQRLIYIDTHQDYASNRGEAMATIKSHLLKALDETPTPLVYLVNRDSPKTGTHAEAIALMADSLELYDLGLSEPTFKFASTFDLITASPNPRIPALEQDYFFLESDFSSTAEQVIRPLLVMFDGLNSQCTVAPSHRVTLHIWNGRAFNSTPLLNLCEHE